MVKNVVEEFENKIKNYMKNFNLIYTKIINIIPYNIQHIEVKLSRNCSKQVNRSIISAKSQKEYFRLILYLAFLDYLMSKIKNRFVGRNHEAIMHLQNLISVFK